METRAEFSSYLIEGSYRSVPEQEEVCDDSVVACQVVLMQPLII